jgi:hypothetical protein
VQYSDGLLETMQCSGFKTGFHEGISRVLRNMNENFGGLCVLVIISHFTKIKVGL